MILPIFLTLCALSIIFVFLGFYKNEHHELAIVGFFFLFLLSLVVLNNGLAYKHGVIRSGNFSYVNQSGTMTLANASVSEINVYTSYQDELGFLTTHRLGYFMALMSAVGMVGAVVSITPFFKRR